MNVIAILIFSAFLVASALAFGIERDELELFENDGVQERACKSQPGGECEKICDCCDTGLTYFCQTKFDNPNIKGGRCRRTKNAYTALYKWAAC
uniref:U16-Hypotoxin-Hsp1a_1 n=1 Tax=Hypochilus sp. SGP-2016 TaxID=1905178 RepID=A0A482ZJE3_9ARAC